MTRHVNYAPAANIAYRHNLGELRQVLDTVYDWLNKSPGAATDVANTLKTFGTAKSLNLNTIAANQKIVTSGDSVPILSAAGGATGVNGTASITAGVFTGNLTPATIGLLVNGGVVGVANSAGATIDASAVVTVSNNIVVNAKLASTIAAIANGVATVPLGDVTAAANGQSNGTAAVASGVVTRITLPNTAKIIKTGIAYPLSAAPTGTWATQVTFTINTSGVITGAVLS